MNLKSTVLGIFIMALSLGYSVNAQENTRIGALLAYGTEIESIGIGVNAEFPVLENLTISPSVIYYLPKEESGFKMNWIEVNANANYYFVTQDNLGVYAIGGLNYSHVKLEYDTSFAFADVSDGRFGLNLGAGANFELGGITPFAELKYVIIDGGQLVIGGGVKFNL